MKPFEYHTATNAEQATDLANKNSQYLAGGTNQIDLMKKHINQPNTLIHITAALPNSIEITPKGVLIGASTSNSMVAAHPDIKTYYPLLSKAILAGASPQIRNMATTGGNLLQRTRCPYFYDTTFDCNKRKPGSGCSALNGHQRMAGIIGNSNACVAVHPSDFCVALAALDAEVLIIKKDGSTKKIPFENFHKLPGDTPALDNNLPANALITAVFVPSNDFNENFAYIKIRERDSYAFALVSAAATLSIKNGVIKEARIASGGVAHKPWRWFASEAYLKNKPPTRAHFERAATIAASEVNPLQNNTFKVPLLEGAITSALLESISTK
ncbi:FAD binding domain-containing protein [Candidatus Ulvibacter alkanivorans]|uniref:FAD binding domain-containing protein n=1 Tax=Candidatus Ulvibacter alkanivorans TaxID=2267620 RepID=UPI000DF2D3C0|nr:xanthine dehydrogenase family protein subunit M [Candidatus Ulvibacter alkanivorans]